MLVETIASLTTFAFGVYLLLLGMLLTLDRETASRFLLGFAGSQLTHFIELSLRILVGAGLIINSPKMLFGAAFYAFGWLLIGTTAILALMPWRWHHEFAKLSLPRVLRHPYLLAAVSAALGAVVLFAAAHEPVN